MQSWIWTARSSRSSRPRWTEARSSRARQLTEATILRRVGLVDLDRACRILFGAGKVGLVAEPEPGSGGVPGLFGGGEVSIPPGLSSPRTSSRARSARTRASSAARWSHRRPWARASIAASRACAVPVSGGSASPQPPVRRRCAADRPSRPPGSGYRAPTRAARCSRRARRRGKRCGPVSPQRAAIPGLMMRWPVSCTALR